MKVGRVRLDRDRDRALVWQATLFPFHIVLVYSGTPVSTGDRIATVWAGGTGALTELSPLPSLCIHSNSHVFLRAVLHLPAKAQVCRQS